MHDSHSSYQHSVTKRVIHIHPALKNQLLFSQRNIRLVVFTGQASEKIVIIS